MAKRRQAIKAILSENNISRQEFRKQGPNAGNLKKSINDVDSFKKESENITKKLTDVKNNPNSSQDDYIKANKEAEDLVAKGNQTLDKAEENYSQVKKYAESRGSDRRKSRKEYISEYKNKLDSQNKIAGDGSTAAEIVSKTDKPLDEAEFNQRVLDRKQKEMEENVTTIDSGTGQVTKTTTPESVAPALGSVLNSAIQSNTAPQVTSDAVLKAGINNAETAGQVLEATKVAEEAKKEAEKTQAQLDAQAVNTANTLEEEEPPLGGNSVTIDAGNGKVTTTGNGKYVESGLQPEVQQTTTETVPIAPVTANVMGNINANPSRPEYTAITNKKDLANDLVNQYSTLSSQIPSAVVEKLGVQDYYPEIGRDIAVGTFTGSRIGSQTIYSGAGGLLPMGLYDARKRALNESAKAKQAEIDKILSIPDTTPQLKESFSQYAYNTLYNDLARNNFNPASFFRDKEAMQNKYRMESVAKNLTYATERAKSMLESSVGKDGKPGTYIPEDLKKQMRNFLSGAVDNAEDYYSGKKDISNFTNQMKTYSNGTVWIDSRRDEWVKNPTEAPISLKTGKELTDANIAEINGAVKAIEEGSSDSDSYMTLLKKYYDINPAVIDRWADNEGYPKDDPARENLKDYMRYQIPAASFVSTVKTMANQNVARARLSLDRDKFNYQKQQDKESYFGTINANINDAVNKQTGKTFNQEIAELKNKGLKGQALNDAIGSVWKQYSYGDVKLIKKGNGSEFYASTIPASDFLSRTVTSKDIYINGKPQRTIKTAVVFKKDGKWQKEIKELTPSQIGQYGKKKGVALYSVDEGDVSTKMTSEQIENYGKSESTIFTKVVSQQIAKGYYDDQNRFHFLNDQNIDSFNSSNRQATLVRDVEQPYSRTPHTEGAGLQVNYVEQMLPGQMMGEWTRIDNSAGQQNKDQQSGYKINQAAEAQGNPDTSSGSGESGGVNISTSE